MLAQKEPAGDITKIKNLEAYLQEANLEMAVIYGTASPLHRYFLLTSPDRRMIFGYDSELHQPTPVFMAELLS